MFRVTIKDIARELNISPSTVSRALNDHPAISQATKNLVKETASRLNYYPNSIAQSLKQQRSKIIGVIVPEIKHEYFASAISGIEEVAYKAGYALVVSQSNEQMEREQFNVMSMINNRVDGLIASRSQSTTDSAHFKKALEVGIPVIFFNRVCEDVQTIKVVSDDFNGAYQATRHLIERGYQRIAHFAGPKILPACRERLAGFQKALQDAGLSCPREWILYGGMHEIDGQRSMEKLLQLKEQPEAILAVNDPVAMGAFTIIKKKGLKIPQDYALVGFSNNSVVALLEPPLTTVDEKPFVLGQKSMELLLASLKGQLELKDKEIRCQTELIIRQST